MQKYQRIMMINNKYSLDGILKGSIGYILEIYDQNFCEIEFSNSDGSTIAVQAINKDDFVVVDG